MATYAVSYDCEDIKVVVTHDNFGRFKTEEEAAKMIVEMCDSRIEALRESKRAAQKIIRDANRKPSLAQMKVINNLASGLEAHTGFYGKSAFGGLSGTIASMHKHGFLDGKGELTDKAKQHIKGREY